jgi:hypothetical protein
MEAALRIAAVGFERPGFVSEIEMKRVQKCQMVLTVW